MSSTLFMRRFDRRLPRVAGLAILASIAIAVTNDRAASRASDSKVAPAPLVAPATLRGIGEWTSPRECDLNAGISTDCVFMD